MPAPDLVTPLSPLQFIPAWFAAAWDHSAVAAVMLLGLPAALTAFGLASILRSPRLRWEELADHQIPKKVARYAKGVANTFESSGLIYRGAFHIRRGVVQSHKMVWSDPANTLTVEVLKTSGPMGTPKVEIGLSSTLRDGTVCETASIKLDGQAAKVFAGTEQVGLLTQAIGTDDVQMLFAAHRELLASAQESTGSRLLAIPPSRYELATLHSHVLMEHHLHRRGVLALQPAEDLEAIRGELLAAAAPLAKSA